MQTERATLAIRARASSSTREVKQDPRDQKLAASTAESRDSTSQPVLTVIQILEADLARQVCRDLTKN